MLVASQGTSDLAMTVPRFLSTKALGRATHLSVRMRHVSTIGDDVPGLMSLTWNALTKFPHPSLYFAWQEYLKLHKHGDLYSSTQPNRTHSHAETGRRTKARWIPPKFGHLMD